MLYGLEAVSLRKRAEDVEVLFGRLDRIRNEYIRGTAHVGRLVDKVRENRLRWFGHVQRRIGRRMLDMELPGRRQRGRPKRRLGPVFALFVPFFCSIPRVQVTQLVRYISISNKSLVYIVGLQLLTSSTYMWVVALSGLVSGMLYYTNVMALQQFLCVPQLLARCSSRLLEPVFSGTEPRAEAPVGMGATLDIQRQQRMDMLDQQLLLSQLAQLRRNAQQPPPQQQGGLLDRFFPGLRQRGQNVNHMQPQSVDTPVAEEQVARLMEMGFSRVDAQEALRASNNDINMATNFLLQH
ncbi:ubiquitin-associated domain-containing protein 2 isoform X3 [Hemibagrus wyckioides]|uniref:ubiquitin-associated domain-containing protein 2 isoform X3 n=1 Tax=Hemibagrus wyckioides TaxID=337641 RepID=UPI00266BA5F0|nr:ubiquitin-associated domain-containing protein 2 isoform X3 [Hemibagrus wyckioides]